MNRTEVAKLLTIVSGFDRRQVDELTVEAWHSIPEVADAEFDLARAIVIHHHGEPGTGYFEARTLVAELRKAARRLGGDVEADVRVAKQLGIVAADWPRRDPLPPEAAARLANVRARMREDARRYEIGGGPDAA
jgi:hypothetical protein